MKRYLPLVLLGFGILVLFFVVLFVKVFSSQGEEEIIEEETVPVIAIENRPFVSLSPSTDGHWLEMNVKKIKISAVSLDYELIYDLPDGRQQGVPGTVKLTGVSEVERDLLLGSESAGKYRYDEGVEKGTLTLRFRDSSGKLAAKFSTDFHLQSNVSKLTSLDNKFSYSLDKNSTKEYFVTMETFGFEKMPPGQITSGPYGVFKALASVRTSRGQLSPTTKMFPGKVGMTGIVSQVKGGSWEKLTDGASGDVGVFIATN